MSLRRKVEEGSTPRPVERRAFAGAVDAVRLTLGDALDALCVAENLGRAITSERNVRQTHSAPDGRSAIAMATGLAASGLRTGVFVDVEDAGVASAFAAAAQLPIPLVVYAVHRGCTDGAIPLMQDAGLVVAPQTVRETAEAALLAHMVSEEILLPSICLLDRVRLVTALRTVVLPAAEQVYSLLESSTGASDSKSVSRQLLFGAKAARVPALVNPTRPLGAGTALDGHTELKARAARSAYFHDELVSAVQWGIGRLQETLGIEFRPLECFGMERGARAVVAAGPIVGGIRAAARRVGLDVGVVGLRIIQPFPFSELRGALREVDVATVLEGSGHLSATGHLLLDRVRLAADVLDGELQPRLVDRLFSRGRCGSVNLYLAATGAASPSAEDLEAVCANMAAEVPRESFFVGVDFEGDPSPLPGVERTQQRLSRAFPHALLRGLAGRSHSRSDGDQNSASLGFHTTLPYDGPATARIVADALFECGRSVSVAFPAGPATSSSSWALLTTGDDGDPEAAHAAGPAQVVAVGPAALLQRMDLDRRVRSGGAVVLALEEGVPPAALLTPSLCRRLEERQVAVFLIDAGHIGREIAAGDPIADALSTQSLAGAAYAVSELLADGDQQKVVAAYTRALTRQTGAAAETCERGARAFEAGVRAVRRWNPDSAADSLSAAEPKAPWTVREEVEPDDTLFSPTRFWETSGYLNEYHREGADAPDPYLSTRTMPPATSAAHRVGRHQTHLPAFFAERCTACGNCWALCPDAAITATVQPIAAITEAAVRIAEQEGPAFTQFGRAAPHVARQAHRLFAADELMQFVRADVLFDAAFRSTADKMGLRDAQRKQLDEEYSRVRSVMAGLPLSGTDVFFRVPEQAAPGSGRALSLTIDLDACKACGICAKICAEAALQMVPAREAHARGNGPIDFVRKLPPPPPEILSPPAHRLLAAGADRSFVGGDDGAPGSGVHIALNLLFGLILQRHRPAWESLRSQAATVRSSLEVALQEKIRESVAVDEFGAFTEALSRSDVIDGAVLSGIARASHHGSDVDGDRLKRLAAVHQDLLRAEEEIGAAPPAPAVVALGGSEALDAYRTFPHNPFRLPWVFHSRDTAPALLRGLFEGQVRHFLEKVRTLRRARLEAEGVYVPAENGPVLDALDWRSLDAQEFGAMFSFVLVTDRLDEGVVGLLKERLPIRILLIHSQIPLEHMQLLGGVFSLPHVFVMQSSIGTPEHLMEGLIEGLEHEGPALFSVYAPEPEREEIAPQEVITIAAVAARSRAFPLWILRPGQTPLAERLVLGNGSPSADESDDVTPLEWAARVGRLRTEFDFVPRRKWHGDMIPAVDYFALATGDRKHFEPYVVFGEEPGSIRKTASPRMIEFAEVRLQEWRSLQELPARRPEDAKRSIGNSRQPTPDVADLAATDESPAPAASSMREAHAALTQKLLKLTGYGSGGGAGEA